MQRIAADASIDHFIVCDNHSFLHGAARWGKTNCCSKFQAVGGNFATVRKLTLLDSDVGKVDSIYEAISRFGRYSVTIDVNGRLMLDDKNEESPRLYNGNCEGRNIDGVWVSEDRDAVLLVESYSSM